MKVEELPKHKKKSGLWVSLNRANAHVINLFVLSFFSLRYLHI
jgi:hypothetical protein